MNPYTANQDRTSNHRSAPWRLAALAAASTVALTACGGGSMTTAANAAPTVTTPAPTTPVPTTPATGVAPVASTEVAIVDFKFTPAALTIKAGTNVVWTNKDSVAHSVNFSTGGIDSKSLNRNDQFSHTFMTPGVYEYICAIHPFMRGTVTVTA